MGALCRGSGSRPRSESAGGLLVWHAVWSPPLSILRLTAAAAVSP